MQGKISANIPKGAIIIVQGMEEEGSITRNIWHSSVYKKNMVRRN